MLRTDKDFAAFEAVIFEAMDRHPIRLLSHCLMGNHWHFVVWPREDGQVTAFFRWLTHTHAMRWRVAHRSVAWGRSTRAASSRFPSSATRGWHWSAATSNATPFPRAL
jgi:putative transposase